MERRNDFNELQGHPSRGNVDIRLSAVAFRGFQMSVLPLQEISSDHKRPNLRKGDLGASPTAKQLSPMCFISGRILLQVLAKNGSNREV